MAANLRERALRLLATREHSRAELARKLAAHGTPDEISEILDRMTELGFLSDERFAAAFVRSKAARFGTQRLRFELARKGVADELIAAALASESGSDDLARAREVWARKFDERPGDPKEWARQARFLQSRGFSTDIICKILKERPGDEPA
ncbi:MAG: recombination regulator RecX [Zoogloea sp.]|nr:recombination regulator RecX [Zoogloea sp.]